MLLCFYSFSFFLSDASQRAGILIIRIWLANHAFITGPTSNNTDHGPELFHAIRDKMNSSPSGTSFLSLPGDITGDCDFLPCFPVTKPTFWRQLSSHGIIPVAMVTLFNSFLMLFGLSDGACSVAKGAPPVSLSLLLATGCGGKISHKCWLSLQTETITQFVLSFHPDVHLWEAGYLLVASSGGNWSKISTRLHARILTLREN